MRRLTVIEYLSLDGVIQAPGDAHEDPAGDFAHGGWTGPFMDDHGRYVREALSRMGTLLLGRLTYEIWAGYWPTVTDPADEIARMLNGVPKYVASSTLTSGSWPETTVIADVAGQVRELKQQSGKDVLVMGSAGLARSLIEDDLVDEYRLMLHLVVFAKRNLAWCAALLAIAVPLTVQRFRAKTTDSVCCGRPGFLIPRRTTCASWRSQR